MFSVLHIFLPSLSNIYRTPGPHSLEHRSSQHTLEITVLSVRNCAQRRHTQVCVGTLCQSWILSQVFRIFHLYPAWNIFFYVCVLHSLERFDSDKQNRTGSSTFINWWFYTTASEVTLLYATWKSCLRNSGSHAKDQTALTWHIFHFCFLSCQKNHVFCHLFIS